jgi:hypothetical protein
VIPIVIDKTDRVGHGSRGWELMSPPDPARSEAPTSARGITPICTSIDSPAR